MSGKFDFTSCVNVKLLFTHRDSLMFKCTILSISKCNVTKACWDV